MDEAQNLIAGSSGLTKLLNKLVDAGMTLDEPRRIKKLAQAKAVASRIVAESEIEIADLHRRAKHRRAIEDARQQANIESIVLGSIADVSTDARAESMNEDWIANFLDKCRITSDEQMQLLWSRILAGEANSPGSYSKRTVNLVRNLKNQTRSCFQRFADSVFISLVEETS